MPRAARTCAEPGCVDITRNRYCPDHDRTTAQRGYDSAHQQLRTEWEPHVQAGEAACWRCGQPILPGEPWDLGHDQGVHAGPEHANRCNRRAAALGGNP